jgi:hypothetical protein
MTLHQRRKLDFLRRSAPRKDVADDSQLTSAFPRIKYPHASEARSPFPSHFMGRMAGRRPVGWGCSRSRISETAPTRHIVRAAHDAPPSPPKTGGGMKTADAAVSCAMTARTASLAARRNCLLTVIASAAKQSMQPTHQTRKLDCFVAFAPRNDGADSSRLHFSVRCNKTHTPRHSRASHIRTLAKLALLFPPMLWGGWLAERQSGGVARPYMKQSPPVTSFAPLTMRHPPHKKWGEG